MPWIMKRTLRLVGNPVILADPSRESIGSVQADEAALRGPVFPNETVGIVVKQGQGDGGPVSPGHILLKIISQWKGYAIATAGESHFMGIPQETNAR